MNEAYENPATPDETGSENPWVAFANEMAQEEQQEGVNEALAPTPDHAEVEGNAEEDPRQSVKLQAALDGFYDYFSKLNKEFDGEIPREIYDSARPMHDQLKKAVRSAKVEETLQVLPEDKRQSFIDYAESDESFLDFDVVTESVYRYSKGDSLESIKDKMNATDWGGRDAEDNAARAKEVYDSVVGFLGVNDKPTGE